MMAIVSYALMSNQHVSYINHRTIAIFAGLFLITLALLLFQSSDRLRLPLLFLVTLGSLTVNVYATLNHFSYLTNTEYQHAIQSLQGADKILKQDKAWYRVAQTFQRTRGDAMMFNYNSGAHFSSSISKSTPTFFGYFGQPDGDNFVNYSNGSLLSDALLGMKYVITPSAQTPGQPGDPQNLRIGHRPDTSFYHLKARNQTTAVWQNSYALPVAFAANNAALSTKLLTNNPMQNQANLWQNLTGATTSPLQVANFNQVIGHNITTPPTIITDAVITKKDPTQPASLDLQFTPTTNDSYYLTIGSGLQIKDFDLLLNGQVIKQFSSYRHTIVINLAANAKSQPQTVTIRFKQTKFLVLNNVTLYHIDQNLFQQQAATLAKQPLHITASSPRQLTGTITTTADQPLIMTTIPKAPGWHITLDGQPVKPALVADYFIAIKTTPGRHTVTWRYTPPLWWLGVAISSVALLGLIFSFARQKKACKFKACMICSFCLLFAIMSQN